ncbi:MAG: glycosyltransferase family 4 protein [Mesorhizobium sp.]|nr:glycosyltransferase family 1 protein [bacterium M00.F.Ca.ET.205.01.1.1]TGU50715.1 glycosyltransferase family 1 protein [bacterium M00.F.Ca.ET.152.01.1.1]TGV34206.1 glycosyltransferase family 1 protein [Mesorhizobium sp. M00.F.Ca.ET.186.01.1.1]TGZ42128.1 glycosyltransferase family 1 protein [bacterium M00.F.Ca.ET.162.01.1.1]TJW33944.1 MAG: glycosyltransferase family 4 protein [Mesorhizobium sp.]
MIHLFNGFQNPFGGSELETLELYRLLSAGAQVRLWATSSKASGELTRQFPIRHISPLKRSVPDGGTYVFLGAHWRNKVWPYLIPRPRRLIYVFNTFHPKVLALTARMPRMLRWPDAELVLISDFQKRMLKVDGVVHPSPIDTGRFSPSKIERTGPFTVGRLSRDTPDKHHPDDVPFYEALLADGAAVRIQGGMLLKDRLAPHPQLELLPQGQLAAELFLPTLDVFYYRTGSHVETFGRVVFEAMACGLPVVCHRHGGYADHINHGENGFLFDTTQQAAQILTELKADPGLRAAVGHKARQTVEALFSPQALRQRLDFYRR